MCLPLLSILWVLSLMNFLSAKRLTKLRLCIFLSARLCLIMVLISLICVILLSGKMQRKFLANPVLVFMIQELKKGTKSKRWWYLLPETSLVLSLTSWMLLLRKKIWAVSLILLLQRLEPKVLPSSLTKTSLPISKILLMPSRGMPSYLLSARA